MRRISLPRLLGEGRNCTQGQLVNVYLLISSYCSIPPPFNTCVGVLVGVEIMYSWLLEIGGVNNTSEIVAWDVWSCYLTLIIQNNTAYNTTLCFESTVPNFLPLSAKSIYFKTQQTLSFQNMVVYKSSSPKTQAAHLLYFVSSSYFTFAQC